MADTPQVIELETNGKGSFIIGEAIGAAGATPTPGHLLEYLAAGTVQEHSTADGISQKMICLPNLPVASDIDAAYVAGETVRFGYAQPGQAANMILAISQTATRITELVSNGDGTLKINADTTGNADVSIVGWPISPVTTTTTGTARIKVRIA